MNFNHFIFSILIGLISFSNPIGEKSCSEFHKSKNCGCKNTERYKLSTSSRGHLLSVGKTITYEVVLYGGSEIIIQCCAEDDFYPIRFKLRSSENGNVIYDNKYNNYIDNINLLLDHTESIAVDISVEPKDKENTDAEDLGTCIGMAIYVEKTDWGK